MTIDVDHKGGVLISATADELALLRDSIDEAIEHGEATGHLMTDEFLATVVVKREDG